VLDWFLAPAGAALPLALWILLSVTRGAATSGAIRLGPASIAGCQLAGDETLHLGGPPHPPVPLGSPGLDAVALQQTGAVTGPCDCKSGVRGCVRTTCTSTGRAPCRGDAGGALLHRLPLPPLLAFEAVQPCPLDAP